MNEKSRAMIDSYIGPSDFVNRSGSYVLVNAGSWAQKVDVFINDTRRGTSSPGRLKVINNVKTNDKIELKASSFFGAGRSLFSWNLKYSDIYEGDAYDGMEVFTIPSGSIQPFITGNTKGISCTQVFVNGKVLPT